MPRRLAVDITGIDVCHVVEAGAGGIGGTAVEQDIATAIAIVNFVRTVAFGAIVTKEAATGVARLVATVDVPVQVGRSFLTASTVGTDVEAAAPLRNCVVDEQVRGNPEGRNEQI